MSFNSQTASVDETPLIRPVPLDELLAAYEKWDEKDNAILAEISAIDAAAHALRTSLDEASVSIGTDTRGDPLDSAGEAVSELKRLRTETAKALEARQQAQRALTAARKEAEVSVAKLGDLRLARITVIVLVLVLAFIAGIRVFSP